MKPGVRFMASLLAAAGLSACGLSPVRSAAADTDPRRWERPAEIVFRNADTATRCDASLFLRCNDRFAEDTLTVRVAVVAPDSLRYEEPFLLVIPRAEGPAALMREVAVPYRRRIRLARMGDYRFRVTPLRPVRGVEAVGVHFETSQ